MGVNALVMLMAKPTVSPLQRQILQIVHGRHLPNLLWEMGNKIGYVFAPALQNASTREKVETIALCVLDKSGSIYACSATGDSIAKYCATQGNDPALV